MVLKAYLIPYSRAGFVFAMHSALAAFVYFCMWLLERFIHLFSSEPMLWNYVPVRYMFEGGAALLIIAIAIHGLKDMWIALESGKAPQRVFPNRDAGRAAQYGDRSD